MDWLLVLGLEEGLIECATVYFKSCVILTYLRPSVSPTGICGIGHIDSHVIQEIWGQSQTKYRVGQLKNMYVIKWKGNPSKLVMWRFWQDFFEKNSLGICCLHSFCSKTYQLGTYLKSKVRFVFWKNYFVDIPNCKLLCLWHMLVK